MGTTTKMIDYSSTGSSSSGSNNDGGSCKSNSCYYETANGISSIPDDILLNIANQYLNPAERSRLTSCNRHWRRLLPTPLRLKIVTSKGDASLQSEFFVSPVDHGDAINYLFAHESLYFGQKYFLWTFDYERGNRVYLGRHTRHGHKATDNGDLQYMYTMGLRPRSPNQCWEVIGGLHGDTVMWGEDIGLSVAGTSTKPRQPDSIESGLLSCLVCSSDHTRDAEILNTISNDDGTSNQWVVLGNHSGPQEKLQLLPCQIYVPGDDVKEHNLPIHAIADVCDEGEYLLHSPESQRDGEVNCEGYHVTVDFEFWVSNGIMHFSAPALPFALGIPILQTDERYSGMSPLANLLEIKSARWGCVIYYMAVAADVSEGKALDMERFLRRVTDHRDHIVQHDEINRLVSIDVCNKSVRTDAPDVPRDTEATWKFILSW